MLFHEIYGAYYNVTAEILALAVEGRLNRQEIHRVIDRKAFDESVLNIPDKLIAGDWNLLTKEYETPLYEAPQMSLTTLQKRWLKAVLLDPRIALFDVDDSGLEDVEPLYTPDMLVCYDQNTNGDPFTDPAYIANFRLLLKSAEEGIPLCVKYLSSKGRMNTFHCVVQYLEYSSKDDRFRAIVLTGETSFHGERIINVGGIKQCELSDRQLLIERNDTIPALEKHTVTIELFDARNVLERMLLHFSHLEKETKKIGQRSYRIKLTYDVADETEILIRLLSFGPVIKVVEPESMVEKIKDRLMWQLSLQGTKTEE